LANGKINSISWKSHKNRQNNICCFVYYRFDDSLYDSFNDVIIQGYIIFTGFALDRNYYEALVLVILGCLSAGLLLFDWFSGRFGHKFQFLFQMRCSKILMYIAGAGILLATLGWLIYDIFFATEIKVFGHYDSL